MDRILVLLRHGQSDWNLKNLFTGWKDPDLTAAGVEEARAAGRLLKQRGLSFDRAFTSNLVRAQHTLQLVLAEARQSRYSNRARSGPQRARLRRALRHSTKTMPYGNGVTSRSISGAGPMMSGLRAAKA